MTFRITSPVGAGRGPAAGRGVGVGGTGVGVGGTGVGGTGVAVGGTGVGVGGTGVGVGVALGAHATSTRATTNRVEMIRFLRISFPPSFFCFVV